MKNIIDVILNVIKLATPSSKKLQKENDVSLFDIQYFSCRKYRRHIVFKIFHILENCHYKDFKTTIYIGATDTIYA